MKNFNVVLLPPIELSKALTDYSQKNFNSLAKGYCLSDDVLPHITLCQFKALAKPDIAMNDIKMTPTLHSYLLRMGEGQHQGYAWAELAVEYKEWLLHLHKYVVSKLAPLGVEILTKNYTPHLTLCRIDAVNVKEIKNLKIPSEFYVPAKPWTMAMGSSDENGQYLGVIK